MVHSLGDGLLPQLKHRFGGDDPPAVWNVPGRRAATRLERERQDDLVLASTLLAVGVVLYAFGKVAWGRSPLRGGLSVFGASPALDRCASQVRMQLRSCAAQWCGLACASR